MAEISPVLQFILSRPQFKGPSTVPGFNLNAPFATTPVDTNEKMLQEQLQQGDYPGWLALYLGGGDAARGSAILDQAKI